MVTATPQAAGLVDREYVAVCIAAELLRVRVAATRYPAADDVAGDVSSLIARPLRSIADVLGISAQVDSLIGDTLVSAPVPAGRG